MRTDEKISVIVPVYNTEEYIARCVDSVLNQSYENIELILVDDGSSDNSGAICDEYLSKDKRVKVIHKKNGGVGSARNAGIDNACGNYIAFVDSDDFIHRDMYKILLENLYEYDADISMGYVRGVFSESYVEPVPESVHVWCFKNNIDALLTIYTKNKEYGPNPVLVVNRIYKRFIFDTLRFSETIVRGEDEFLIPHALIQSKRTVYSDMRLYFYWRRSGSATQKVLTDEEKCKDTLSLVGMTDDREKLFSPTEYLPLYRENCICAMRIISESYFTLHDKSVKKNLREHFSKYYNIACQKNFLYKKEKFEMLLFRISPSLYSIIPKLSKLKQKLNK